MSKFYVLTTLVMFASSPVFANDLNKVISVQQSQIASLQLRIADLEHSQSPCSGFGEVVYNSVYNPNGVAVLGRDNTATFWNIPYAKRLEKKGHDIRRNYYDGTTYQRFASQPAIWTDIVEDLDGKVAVLFQARSTKLDTTTMKVGDDTQLISGNNEILSTHFKAGWSAPDRDGDLDGSANCASYYGNVTQHYGACWVYNLAADAEAPYADAGWGPHFSTSRIPGMATDGSSYTRVNRITRCVKSVN